MILFLIFPAIIVAVTGYDCQGGKLTPHKRKKIVDEHNKHRSDLIKGKLSNKDGNLMPKGKNMMEMSLIMNLSNARTWDCELEISAQNWADQCVFGNSPKYQRGVGENIYTLRSPGSAEILKTSAPMLAIESWWTQLSQFYRNNPSNIFTPGVASQGVSHFTQVGQFF
ncbi:unnamed protein product [Onchocerca ochengi]|uniref:SCP domain-containing protein n=1 Tax=Onchocerca ochengi TaxID=42157 RepID=A0A182ESL8_ONCOC|nr:unnamed protein product [Onchocerca ochengi]